MIWLYVRTTTVHRLQISLLLLHGCSVTLLFDCTCWAVCIFRRSTMYVLFQWEYDAFLFFVFSWSTMIVLFQLDYDVCFVSVRVWCLFCLSRSTIFVLFQSEYDVLFQSEYVCFVSVRVWWQQNGPLPWRGRQTRWTRKPGPAWGPQLGSGWRWGRRGHHRCSYILHCTCCKQHNVLKCQTVCVCVSVCVCACMHAYSLEQESVCVGRPWFRIVDIIFQHDVLKWSDLESVLSGSLLDDEY